MNSLPVIFKLLLRQELAVFQVLCLFKVRMLTQLLCQVLVFLKVLLCLSYVVVCFAEVHGRLALDGHLVTNGGYLPRQMPVEA